MNIELLGAGAPPWQVLRALSDHAGGRGLAQPAALIGDWLGSAAIIAPSLRTGATDPTKAFATESITAPEGFVGGGFLGFRGYPDVSEHDGNRRIPESAGGWTDHVLRLDHDGQWWFESLLDEPCPDHLRAAVAQTPAARPWSIDWAPPNRDRHRAGVECCLEAIRAGEVYQACVCGQFTGRVTGSSLSFFADAVAATRPAKAAYVQGDWGAIASLSPELFLRRSARTVTSSPIKGTLAINRNPTALRESVKDVAENVMIVDLVRNDLARVSVPGSVVVTELLAVQPAPGVWHLVSTVQSQLDGATDIQLIDAAFPPASVTGTPKLRARQYLSQWEHASRGIYCGAIGIASPAAGLELSVAIRTVEFTPDGRATLGVGGGITIDSDPDQEWQECLDKAATIVTL